MQSLSTQICVLLVCLPVIQAGVYEWSYDGEEGPSTWHQEYMDCGGVRQSPIDIDTNHVLYNPELKTFNLSDYSKTDGITLNLVNQGGHTAQVNFMGDLIRLRGGNLPDNYILAQFHFHWGSDRRRGSEHKLNGESFPMELHLVHYQEHLKNITAAAAHPSGLAVLGYFFTIGNRNEHFEPLLSHFDKIHNSGGAAVTIPTFSLLSLLPSAQPDFFRYDGSLTTPPCYESVIWSLATDFIEISDDQMEVFRGLLDSHNQSLVNDFRPVQPLNSRTVTVSHAGYKSDRDAGVLNTPSVWLLALLLLFSALFSAQQQRHQ